jgi:putative ABC transport system permease protein
MLSLLRIAVRNVLRHRRRSLITFSAVFLALAIMVGIRGFMNGMQSGMRDSIVKGQTGQLQIHRRGYLKNVAKSSLEMDLPASDEFIQKVTTVPGVTHAAARIQFGGMLNARDSTTVALFTAIDPEQELQVCPLRLDQISSGKPLLHAPVQAGNLSPELAASLGAKLGDKTTLLTNDRDGVLNALEVEVVGTVGARGVPLPDKKVGLVTLSLAQELLRMQGRATEIVVSIRDGERLHEMQRRIQTAIGSDYEVATWLEIVPWLEDAFATQDFGFNLLVGIFLFVALLGVVNTMLMAVYERTREIGTMMSVGVRRRQILALFLLEAAILGLAGGVLGAAAGCACVAYLSHAGVTLKMGGAAMPLTLHPFIQPGYVVFVLLLATAGATLAALWPSLRASRLRPVEALSSL